MDTPPRSTLSTPSPTELHDTNPLEAEARTDMSRSITSKTIYLVVATTRCTSQGQTKLGIGLKGGLPWPMIKADMAYFRKVTTEGKPSSASSTSSHPVNSVIMGRKTFESIPPKFRPLPGRTNIILTRTRLSDLAEEIITQLKQGVDKESDIQTSTHAMDDNIEIRASRKGVDLSTIVVTGSAEASVEVAGNQIYCIGGAEIYSLFLRNQSLRPRLRILQTVIEKLKVGEEFECDTFWPESLDGELTEWREATREEVTSWTGINVPQGQEEWAVDEKVGVRLRVVGWEMNQT